MGEADELDDEVAAFVDRVHRSISLKMPVDEFNNLAIVKRAIQRGASDQADLAQTFEEHGIVLLTTQVTGKIQMFSGDSELGRAIAHGLKVGFKR